ncbi:MAG: hypothetical protein AAB617_03310 [Patescibacteria group bacterium]
MFSFRPAGNLVRIDDGRAKDEWVNIKNKNLAFRERANKKSLITIKKLEIVTEP